MKKLKTIKNRIDGHNLNSKYWQSIKNSRPLLNQSLFDTAVGMGSRRCYNVSSKQKWINKI